MRLENFPLEYKNPLVKKFLYDFDAVSELFSYNPHNLSSFEQRALVVDGKYNMDREKLVDTLKEYNKTLGCGDKAITNIEKLLDDKGLIIITGQQPGVFTGPLYTVYKAMTAIQMAAKLSDRLNRPVVPVFWVGSEDHDFGEINHVDLLTQENRLERIRLEDAPGRKISVGNISINNDTMALIEKLVTNSPDSEFKPDIVEKIKSIARESDNLGDWFAGLMAWLFADYGLVIVNPMYDGRLQEMGREAYRRFICSTEQINQAFRRGQEKVRSCGGTPQVDKEENSTHLFIYVDDERLPLLAEGDRFYIPGRDLEWTRNELLHILDQKPESISANVVLKPVWQDYIFPILGYIAGPGEISYYALFKDIYPIVGGEMPIIYPRANITIIEKAIGRYMDKFNLSLEDALYHLDDKLEILLAESDEVGVDGLFAGFKERFETDYNKVINQIALLDSNLKNLGEENTRRIISQIEHLEGKARQQLRKKNEDSVRQFEKIRFNLAPHNNMQERVYNIFPYLFKYSLDLIKTLMSQPLTETIDHKMLYL